MQKWLAAALLATIFIPGLAFSEEKMHDTVVVTASRISESARTVPQSMVVIDSETLDKNQYEDLANLLQNYGFQILSYGPSQTSAQIGIRGLRSDYSNPLDSNVLVLVNGVPIATTNLSMIPMDGIEQIEILRGPGAVQYGSSAIGGVINIIPKRGGEKFHLSAEGGGGTWNSWRALGSLSGSKDLFDFAGAVTWNRQGSNYTTGDGKLYPDTEVQGRLNYIMNFGVNFNEENRLGAVILGARDKGLGLNNELTPETSAEYSGSKANMINSSADINYAGGYSPAGLSWKLRYFNAYSQSNYDYEVDSRDYDIDINQRGGQGQLSWTWNFLTLTGGVDYTDNEYLTSSIWSHNYQQKNTAGFGMAKLSFLDELIVLTGGIRHDSYTAKVSGKEERMDNTSLSAGIAVNPLDWLTIKASYGDSYKLPSGLYVIGYEGAGGRTIGNPDLKPEKGYGWDAGIDIHWRSLKVALSYFSTLYTDKIISTYSDADFATKYVNADGISYYNGLEGEISLDLGDFFEWDFELRPYFNFTKMFNYNDDNGSRLPMVRDFVAGYGISFNHPEWGTSIDVRLNYLGYQKEPVFDNTTFTSEDKRTGGKTTLDIFLAQKIYEFEDGGKFTLKAEARNLANENYAYRYGYPLPGRSFYVGVRYDF